MREADRRTIESFGVPGFTLMESAGRAAADVALSMLTDRLLDRVVCLCGKGNNGGDGFVIARTLSQHGVHVDVCLVGDSNQLTEDAARNHGLVVELAEKVSNLRVVAYSGLEALETLTGAALYVDALLGTGLSSDVRDPLTGVISWLNLQKAPILSVDLPSGLDSDDGRIMGIAVEATRTVTFGAYKTGLLIGDGPDITGSVQVAEMGIPRFILDELVTEPGSARVCDRDYVRELLPERTRQSHKYASGPTILFGGSDQFPGAPTLAATAAARVGSGYVVSVCPPSIGSILAEKLTEIPVMPWISDDSGPDLDATIDQLGNRWEKARSVLVGPGLGRESATMQFVLDILRVSPNAVVDADGLYALIGQTDFVRDHSNGRWILTPHAGEFRRLCGDAVNLDNPVEAARAFAREWNVVLLLKGLPSVTAAPDGRVMINDTGNPAVATAGSGDVLAGMVAGLVARGIEPFEAATAAIHIGGAIADLYARDHAMESMMASDILRMIPDNLSDQA